jgi:hypothetical protein
LVGSALGIPVDLSRVQLNLRLVPLDDTARTMNELLSAAVDALQLQPDANQAASIIVELNQLFGS